MTLGINTFTNTEIKLPTICVLAALQIWFTLYNDRTCLSILMLTCPGGSISNIAKEWQMYQAVQSCSFRTAQRHRPRYETEIKILLSILRFTFLEISLFNTTDMYIVNLFHDLYKVDIYSMIILLLLISENAAHKRTGTNLNSGEICAMDLDLRQSKSLVFVLYSGNGLKVLSVFTLSCVPTVIVSLHVLFLCPYRKGFSPM